jgi:hypothetical protein
MASAKLARAKTAKGCDPTRQKNPYLSGLDFITSTESASNSVTKSRSLFVLEGQAQSHVG